MKIRKIVMGLVFATAIVGANEAQADAIPGWESLNFNYTLSPGVTVSNIVFFDQQGSNGIGYQYYDATSGLSGTGTYIEPWPYPAIPGFYPVTAAFGVGLVTGVPGDPLTNHLALFGAQGIMSGASFSTLFPNVASENALLHDIVNQVHLDGPPFPDPFTMDGFMALYNDALNDGLFIPVGGSFDVAAFSTGQVVGGGTLTASVPGTSTVPEPSSLGIFAAALAILAGLFGLGRRKPALD